MNKNNVIKIGIRTLDDPFEGSFICTPYYIYFSECEFCKNISRKIICKDKRLMINCDRCNIFEILPFAIQTLEYITFAYWCNNSIFISDIDDSIDRCTLYEIKKMLEKYDKIENPAWAVKVIRGECEFSIKKVCVQQKCIYNSLCNNFLRIEVQNYF